MLNSYPITMDHSDWSYVDPMAVAENLIHDFCILNRLPIPQINAIDSSKIKGKRGARARGYCTSKSIWYSRGVTPAKNPGWSWSYPGFKADMTCIGIAAHELGHWWRFKEGNATGSVLRLDPLFACTIDTESVSSYEPNLEEMYAESVRLFILNPDLLRLACPIRSLILSAQLTPLHSAPWEEVLKHAGEKRIAATRNWISKRQNLYPDSVMESAIQTLKNLGFTNLPNVI